ncbi:MAG: hypothetical protein LBP59_11955 [Planctomycetaceae bacterium]|nr:hypothetical protein [Planctomycetaceae bacterium]
MKTISIPRPKKSVTKNFKIISPPAPHVNFDRKHETTSTNRKSKHLRKRNIVTKNNDAENNINAANTNTTIVKQAPTPTLAPKIKTETANVTANVMANVTAEMTTAIDPTIDLVKPISDELILNKSVADKRTHININWPRQIKGKKSHQSTINSTDNNNPFDADEVATLDEFENISKTDDVKIPQKTTKKQNELSRRPPKQRRRQIDPTTCERDYSLEEIEFMNAINEYKRSSGRMFPTCSEILEVLKNLGYEKINNNRF